ncbi:hypothetical protein DMUE_5775 [Dictyocoela muelleri]|nr:hypothetical protein DMUE_5775 [Dictyocoela muelleri]
MKKQKKINKLSNYVLPYIYIKSKNDNILEILIDSGATSSFIKQSIAERENWSIIDTNRSHIKTATGNMSVTSGSINCKISDLNNLMKYEIDLEVLDDLEEEIILGANLLKKI